MLGLVPRDHWEHKFSDFLSSLASALIPRKNVNTLHIPEIGHCIPVRSGRAGLVAAIQALNLPNGARIGVPLYCCSVVFKAITIAGCIPRFIDIKPDTFCISADDLSSKISQLDAVIAAHMFGNMCDMPELMAASKGKPIIEDCAQALGSKLDGRPAGSFGDIAFFSFRSGKYLSVGEGGALFSRHTDIQSRVKEIIDKMSEPNRADESIHATKNYIKSILRSKPFYGTIGYPLWTFVSKTMNLSENPSVALGQIYSADLATIMNRFSQLDVWIERQRANAVCYSDALRLHPGMLCDEKPGAFYNRYLYPITFPSTKQRDDMASYLLKRDIDTMKYLDDVLNIAIEHYVYSGDCPVAEALSKKVLIIPNYYSLNKTDVQRIAHCLNEGWAKIKNSD